MFKKNESKIYKTTIRKEEKQPPTVYINQSALLKMKQYVDNCDKEIGWLGSVTKKEDGSFFIEDVFLIKQKVSGVTTELDEEAMNKFFDEIRKTKGIEEMSKIRLWGHSHVNMEVHASLQDNETFEEYYNDCNFFIRIIANKKGEMKLDVADNKSGYIFENIPWRVWYKKEIYQLMQEYEEVAKQLEMLSAELETEMKKASNEDDIKKEIKEKVIPEVYRIYSSPKKNKKENEYESYYDYYYGGGWYSEGEDDYSEMELEYFERLYKKADNYSKIPVKTSKNVTSYKKITDVLSIEEIDEIEEFCINGKDLKTLYKNDERFIDYSSRNWEDLLTGCQQITYEVKKLM